MDKTTMLMIVDVLCDGEYIHVFKKMTNAKYLYEKKNRVDNYARVKIDLNYLVEIINEKHEAGHDFTGDPQYSILLLNYALRMHRINKGGAAELGSGERESQTNEEVAS